MLTYILQLFVTWFFEHVHEHDYDHWDGSTTTLPSEHGHEHEQQDHVERECFSWSLAILPDHGRFKNVYKRFSCKKRNEYEHRRFCKQFCKQAIATATCKRVILQYFRVKITVKWWWNELNGKERGTYLVKTYCVKMSVIASVLENHFRV